MNHPNLQYGSVCSGIEAVSLAWQPLGWHPAGFRKSSHSRTLCLPITTPMFRIWAT